MNSAIKLLNRHITGLVKESMIMSEPGYFLEVHNIHILHAILSVCTYRPQEISCQARVSPPFVLHYCVGE